MARDTSFNAVHLASGVKVDVFVVGADPFDAHRVASGRSVHVGDPPGAALRVDTAEHTVLRKLEWYRRAGETSERQWRDVVGVLRVQGTRRRLISVPGLLKGSARLAEDDGRVAFAWGSASRHSETDRRTVVRG